MKRKSPFLGGLLNLFIPGLSNVYLGRWDWALLQFFSTMLLLVLFLALGSFIAQTDPPWPGYLTAVALGLLWLLIVFLDGVQTVRRYNRAASGEAVPAGARQIRVVVAMLAIALVVCALVVLANPMTGLLHTERWAQRLAADLPPTAATGAAQVAATAVTQVAAAEPPAAATPDSAAGGAPDLSTAMSASTAKPNPTAEPAGTPGATFPPQAVVSRDQINLRSGPGSSYRRVAVLRRGDTMVVTDRNQAGTWLAVTLPDGRQGWVNTSHISLEEGGASMPGAAQAAAARAPAESAATQTVDEQIAAVARASTAPCLSRGRWAASRPGARRC